MIKVRFFLCLITINRLNIKYISFDKLACIHVLASAVFIYTERKKKRNTKFDIELQDNTWIFTFFFTPRKSNQLLIDHMT